MKKSKRIVTVAVIVVVLAAALVCLWLWYRGSGEIVLSSESVNLPPVEDCEITVEYEKSELNVRQKGGVWYYDSDYGNYEGTLVIPTDGESVTVNFGFVNPNNRHKVKINIDYEINGSELTVTQTVKYAGETLTTTDTGIVGEDSEFNVYRPGV